MDHLKTDIDRQDRWYSRTVQPRFVAVVAATESKDLEDAEYDIVRSIPFEWIRNPPHGVDLLATLKRHGFLVISSVLRYDECCEALDLSWDWIRAATIAEQACSEKLNEDQVSSLAESLACDENLASSRYFPRSVEGGEN